ncbi:MAG: hypothetical protein ACHQ51_04060 [Elusimicrobiota bacterium]
MQAAPQGRTHIYEVVNHSRKESLIVLCPDAPPDFRRRLAPPRPAPVAHWAPEEEFEVDQIAAAMTVSDAEEFLALFLDKIRSRDWKMIPWRL